jgi:predicted dehydrogenase
MSGKGRQCKLGIGIIGAGIGRHHALGYARCREAKILAVCDPDLARAEKLAAEFSIPHIFSDYREMLKLDALNAVSICTPNYLHAPMTVAAFQAGKHVICEKPLALNLKQGKAMVAAGKKAGKIFMLAFNNRFRGDAQKLKGMIEVGELGEIYYAKTGWLRRAGIPGRGSSWFTTKEKSGGGALVDLGVHMLDLALWLMDNPRVTKIKAASYAAFGPRGLGFSGYSKPEQDGKFDVEDLACAFLQLANGATLALEAGWAGHIEGDISYTQLLGTKAGAELAPLRIHKEVRGKVVDLKPKCPEQSGHMMEIRHFVDCLAKGEEPLSPGEQGLEIIRILEGIYRSAASGKEVVLPPARKT